MKKNYLIFISGIIVIIIILILVWTRGGFASFYLSTDLGRDLSEMSNIRMNKVVWLGPRLSPGFPTSPIYYYLNYPILIIANWNANSLFVFTVILGLTALVLLVLSSQKRGLYSLAITLCFGLTPLWKLIAIQPGNGYTYAIWLFFFLVSTWFEYPIIIGSFFLGLAISYHPGALFGIPILLFELRSRGSSLLTWVGVLLTLLAPWAPIIVFEWITRGFLLRNFLKQETAVSNLIQPNLQNIHQIANLSGLGGIIFVTLFILSGLLAKGRLRIWFYLSAVAILFFLISPPFPTHYALGIACICMFSIFTYLSESYRGRVLIILLVTFYLVQSTILSPTPKPTRSIPKISNVVEKYIKIGKLDPKSKLAVVAILDSKVSVPQADDYRYFFRVKGFNVEDVTNYSQADSLLLFIEEPDFDWQKWSSWETDQFGQRILRQTNKIDGITVARFTKK